MVLWCAAAMFLCGWLALGKKPYQALLIGITLSVVVGAPPGDMHTALWRSGDVIFGSLLAMLFTGIWPQRAFIHWRIQMASYVTNFNRLYQAGFSPNLVDRPRLESICKGAQRRGQNARADHPRQQRDAYPEGDLRGYPDRQPQPRLHAGAADQRLVGNRPGHFVMLNAHTLRETQQMTQQTLLAIAHALYEGNPQPCAPTMKS
jgi:uncharacterized membrane protein YccC